MLSGTRVRAIEARQRRAESAIVMLATEVARVSRPHRRPDLSKPQTIELRDLGELVDTAVRQGVQKLFDRRYFTICDFDALVDLAGVYPPPDLRKHLKPLHCMDWSDMDPEYREQIQNHIMACFVPVEREGERHGA